MSIFHFFADLAEKKEFFREDGKLEKFPFDKNLIETEWAGKFPDIMLRVNHKFINDTLLCGGEFLELKDCKSYTVASFNSTIPTGEKNLADTGIKGIGTDALPVRQVYYLLRGRRNRPEAVKVCLVHGSFFETVKVPDLISGAFSQALDAADSDNKLSREEKQKLVAIMSSQEVFSTSRKVEKSSVSLRFRIMSEVRKEANILKNYTEILDNTLNLIVPMHGKSDKERDAEVGHIKAAAKAAHIWNQYHPAHIIKHPFNGYFWVLRVPIV